MAHGETVLILPDTCGLMLHSYNLRDSLAQNYIFFLLGHTAFKTEYQIYCAFKNIAFTHEHILTTAKHSLR